MPTTTRRTSTRQPRPRGRFARGTPPRRPRARRQQRASGVPLATLRRLPINRKILTGILGAGAAGTAFLRKRRARGAQDRVDTGGPPQ